MNKEQKDKINEIEEKIREVSKNIRASEGYRNIDKEEEELWSLISDKNEEILKIEKPIYSRYLREDRKRRSWSGYRYFEVAGVKQSVKLGIKRGLGIKFLNQLEGDEIVRIVKELIKKDLEKTPVNKISEEISELQKKVEEVNKRKEKLMSEVRLLEEKINKLLKKKSSVKIDFLERIYKIKEEVEKGLLLDGLE